MRTVQLGFALISWSTRWQHLLAITVETETKETEQQQQQNTGQLQQMPVLTSACVRGL